MERQQRTTKTTFNNQRQKPLKIRVTFPDGKVICHAIVLHTFIETLKTIGTENFEKIKLKVGDYPLISKTKHKKYGDGMKPIADGWFVNIQSDTAQKYMQLISIKQQLNLDIKIELGRNFETTRFYTGRTRKTTNLATIINDEMVIDEPISVYIKILKHIGLEKLKESPIRISNQKIVTPINLYDGQLEVEQKQWITLPPQPYSRSVIKWLQIILSVTQTKLVVQQFSY